MCSNAEPQAQGYFCRFGKTKYALLYSFCFIFIIIFSCAVLYIFIPKIPIVMLGNRKPKPRGILVALGITFTLLKIPSFGILKILDQPLVGYYVVNKYKT